MAAGSETVGAAIIAGVIGFVVLVGLVLLRGLTASLILDVTSRLQETK